MKRVILTVFSLPFTKTAKDTYWLFGSNIATSFLAFLYTILLVRTLSPSQFGIFSAVIAFTLLISGIGDLGIGSGLSRFLPPLYSQRKMKQANSLIKTSFIFQASVSLFLFLLIMTFSPFLAGIILKDEKYWHLFIISGFGVIGIIYLALVTFSLSAQKKFPDVAVINTVSTLIKLVLMLILYFFFKLTITLALVAFMVSFFITWLLVPLFLPYKFIFAKASWKSLKKLLSYSIYLGVSKLFASTSSRLDALMLIPLSSSYEAGIYSAAFKIASFYVLLASSFSMVIAPRLSSFANISESVIYLKKVTLAVLGILATMVVMYLMAPFLVVFILGTNYSASVAVFQALLLPMALFTLTIPSVNFLLYSLTKPQVSTFNTFIAIWIIFFSNLFLIPKFGRFGPIISLSLAYSFTLVSSCLFALYFYKKEKNDK